MEVVIADEHKLAQLAADAIERLLRTETAPVLGLATGSSPLRIYDELAARHKRQGLSFAHAQAFMLDEYVGIAADHPERYRNVIDTEIATRVDFAEAGGIDLQILGIGTDGHIAFNEPGSSLASRTRVKSLTYQTRVDNARFFDGDVDQVPSLCLTQGLGTIMEARHLVLVATGGGKAEAVHQMIEGPVSAMWPATVLQMHPHVTVLVDDAAASRLQLGDYYRHAFENKPDWQHL